MKSDTLLALAERYRMAVVTIPETVIIGDPDAPLEEERVQQQVAGVPMVFYTPTKHADRQILLQQGYQDISGIGFVPPDKVEEVKRLLQQGYVYHPGWGF